MLEVKSPWDKKRIGSVKTNNAQEIEKILTTVNKVSKLKGLDFPPKERIEVLKSFCKKIQNNI